jgi:hypothetical protein
MESIIMILISNLAACHTDRIFLDKTKWFGETCIYEENRRKGLR